MPGTGSGYLLEIPYTPQFHREHAPLWFDAVLAALGQQAPRREHAVWCEAGCGSGFGLVILAATNPSVTFHGIDVNPEHIQQARVLAEEAGIANVEFHCADVRQADGLPDFDHIVVRGVYSWVSPEVRQTIRRFLGQRLKPEGAGLLHYLALPGAADFMAVHGLLRALHNQPGMTAREAVKAGQDILAKLHDGKAGFFATHPVVELKAMQIISDDPDYTAHDYLNTHYAPLAAAEVIYSMRQEGLDFVGSAAPEDNLDDFSIPGNLRGLFGAQESVAMRETIRDLSSNQFSRIDLYMRPAEPLAGHEHFAALRKLRFRALPAMPAKGGVTFETRIGKVEGPAEIFSPILDRLAKSDAVSYAEIEALPALRGNPGVVNQAVHAMMGAGAIHPAPETPPDAEPARRLNAVLLDRHREGHPVPALASPAIASGLTMHPKVLDGLSREADVPANLRRLLP